MEKPATPLPCPFCGSADLLIQPWHGGGPNKHLVGCRNADCEAAPAVTGETLAEAIAAWNRRVPDCTAINAELVGALSIAVAYLSEVPHGAATKIATALARAKENSNGSD